jgi:hypothetical protein
MAPEHSVNGGRRHRANNAVGNASPRVEARGRVNSLDIRQSGALFPATEESYPSQLNSSDEDEMAMPSEAPRGENPSPAPLAPSLASGSASSPGSSTPRPSAMMDYFHSNPYLPPSELAEFRRQRRTRADASGGTRITGTSPASSIPSRRVKRYKTMVNPRGQRVAASLAARARPNSQGQVAVPLQPLKTLEPFSTTHLILLRLSCPPPTPHEELH